MVELGGTRQPIVQAADEALLEIRTVTRITAESDDEEAFASRSATQCLELQTKTETQAESDDQCISTGTILELETKTSHNVEEDKADIDTFCDASASVPPSLIELMTKTDVQVER
ncbi:hypothetical protein M2324_003804 [Rhodovulum sulfidophilum]|uniref:hypothetical protein n=1 Tax=Rhodovulum sulfidophilum TaxID=35806 RepID=UPI0018C86897|nr:hypothetical protein [Rhodovulum sulfidophilum]MCW2305382.1 hypothetical protein [Rhodovulum sulfidophilum]